MRIHSRSTLGSAFSAFWRASALLVACPSQTIHSWVPGRSLASGPETASILPPTSAMTFQLAMWLSSSLAVNFTKVGRTTSYISPLIVSPTVPGGTHPLREKLAPTRTDEALPRKIACRIAVMRDDLKSGDPKCVLAFAYPESCPPESLGR